MISYYDVLDEKRGLGGKWATFSKKVALCPQNLRLFATSRIAFLSSLSRPRGGKRQPLKRFPFSPGPPLFFQTASRVTHSLFLHKEEKDSSSHHAVLDEKRGLGGKWATFSRKVALCPQNLRLPATSRLSFRPS